MFKWFVKNVLLLGESKPGHKLVKRHHNFHVFLFDTFARRYGELLAFLSGFVVQVLALQCNGRIFEGFIVLVFLLLGNAIAFIHIIFDFFVVFFNVIDDLVLNGPFEEIQLSNGGFHAIVVIVRDGNAFPTTKGVKSAFGVGFQL